MSLYVYLIVALTTASGLHWASAKSAFRSRAKRSILGGTIGTSSYGIFTEWASTISILEQSIEGELGFYGFIFATGFFALCGVWTWNLWSTRKYLVQ